MCLHACGLNSYAYAFCAHGARCDLAGSGAAPAQAASYWSLAEAWHLCRQLFESLDRCEAILGKQRYIAGDELTEADLRLFQTLIRFDPVYVVSQA